MQQILINVYTYVHLCFNGYICYANLNRKSLRSAYHNFEYVLADQLTNQLWQLIPSSSILAL